MSRDTTGDCHAARPPIHGMRVKLLGIGETITKETETKALPSPRYVAESSSKLRQALWQRETTGSGRQSERHRETRATLAYFQCPYSVMEARLCFGCCCAPDHKSGAGHTIQVRSRTQTRSPSVGRESTRV